MAKFRNEDRWSAVCKTARQKLSRLENEQGLRNLRKLTPRNCLFYWKFNFTFHKICLSESFGPFPLLVFPCCHAISLFLVSKFSAGVMLCKPICLSSWYSNDILEKYILLEIYIQGLYTIYYILCTIFSYFRSWDTARNPKKNPEI